MGAPENQLLQQVVNATHPTLLERYREDPIALRQNIERAARRQRAADIAGFLNRLFRNHESTNRN